MTYRDKTQSFTYTKQQNQSQKNLRKYHSPQKSVKVSSSKGIDLQIPSMRFLRKQISKNEEFDPRVYITGELSYEDVVDIKEVFDTYDSSSMGVLMPNDLKLFMEQNGFSPNKTTVYDILAEFDEGETGGISFKDFMRAMGSKPKNQTKKEISAVFKKYDIEGKGYLDFASIKQANKRIKEDLKDNDINEIFKKNEELVKDGKIYFEEFYQIMVKGYSWY